MPEPHLEIPELLPAVSARLTKEFSHLSRVDLNKHSQGEELQRRRFGKEIYEGHLDKVKDVVYRMEDFLKDMEDCIKKTAPYLSASL